MQIQRKPGSQRHLQGSALLLCILTVSSLSMIGLAYIHMALQSDAEIEGMMGSVRADRLAEAALCEAITAVSRGFTGAVGSRQAPARMGEGVFWVDAATDDGFTSLTAHACIGGGVSSREVVISTGTTPVAAPGVFGREGVKLTGWVTVDSYDSAAGFYWTQNPTWNGSHPSINDRGNIASNGTIELSKHTHVYGDVTAGPDESIDLNDAYVSGTVENASASLDLPDILVPEIPFTADLEVLAHSLLVLPPGEYGFEELSLSASSTLTIRGPATLRLRDLKLFPSAIMYLDTSGGDVTFHIEEGFKLHPNCAIYGFENDASRILFNYVGTKKMHLLPGLGVTGVFYAPNADIWISPGAQIYGAVLGNVVSMRPGSSLHFDERLLASAIDSDEAPTFSRILWRNVERHPDLLQCVGSNPFHALDLDKDSLRSPADSWSSDFHPGSNNGQW